MSDCTMFYRVFVKLVKVGDQVLMDGINEVESIERLGAIGDSESQDFMVIRFTNGRSVHTWSHDIMTTVLLKEKL